MQPTAEMRNLTRPADHLLATAREDSKGYPLEVNRGYNAFCLFGVHDGNGPPQHYFERVCLTKVYVHRKLRWYHRALNAMGASYTELQCIEVDPDLQVLWHHTLTSVAIRHLPKIGIFVSCDTRTGELRSSAANVNVLGYDIAVAIGRLADKRTWR